MNKELLLKVKDKILAEPDQFNMRDWFIYNPELYPKCGTSACIAGWVICVHDQLTPDQARNTHLSVERDARLLLGLNHLQADILFCDSNWPKPFRDRYTWARESSEKRASVTAEFIDWFIENYEQRTAAQS